MDFSPMFDPQSPLSPGYQVLACGRKFPLNADPVSERKVLAALESGALAFDPSDRDENGRNALEHALLHGSMDRDFGRARPLCEFLASRGLSPWESAAGPPAYGPRVPDALDATEVSVPSSAYDMLALLPWPATRAMAWCWAQPGAPARLEPSVEAQVRRDQFTGRLRDFARGTFRAMSALPAEVLQMPAEQLLQPWADGTRPLDQALTLAQPDVALRAQSNRAPRSLGVWTPFLRSIARLGRQVLSPRPCLAGSLHARAVLWAWAGYAADRFGATDTQPWSGVLRKYDSDLAKAFGWAHRDLALREHAHALTHCWLLDQRGFGFARLGLEFSLARYSFDLATGLANGPPHHMLELASHAAIALEDKDLGGSSPPYSPSAWPVWAVAGARLERACTADASTHQALAADPRVWLVLLPAWAFLKQCQNFVYAFPAARFMDDALLAGNPWPDHPAWRSVIERYPFSEAAIAAVAAQRMAENLPASRPNPRPSLRL